MNNKLNNFFIFAAGVAVGSVVTWKVLNDRYEQVVQEEAESIREALTKVYLEREDDTEDDEEEYEAIKRAKKPDLTEYRSMLTDEGYVSQEEAMKKVDRPYVIPPDEFGELFGYEQVSLYYYADEVLTTTQNEEVDYVDDVVGLDSLTHFGEYEDDSVFVRNDRLKVDYEILLVNENFSDVVNTTPHDGEVE